MFLDGMGGDQLSWQQNDKACCNDHTEGDPLDGVEDVVGRVDVGVRLTKEGEEELDCSCDGQCEGEGVTRMLTTVKLAEQGEGQQGSCEGGVERDGVEAGVIWRDVCAPREGGGEASVVALGEVSKGEERPDEGGAGTPCVEGIEDWEAAYAEVDHSSKDGEDDAGGAERRHHEEKNRIGEEVVEVGEDEKEAGECEG